MQFQELETIKDRVEWFLENQPETRNSDKLLLVRYLRKHYGIDISIILKDDIPCMESIRRARQYLQQRNVKYRSVPEVDQAKKENEAVYAESFRTDRADR